jgi:hypothetical protein
MIKIIFTHDLFVAELPGLRKLNRLDRLCIFSRLDRITEEFYINEDFAISRVRARLGLSGGLLCYPLLFPVGPNRIDKKSGVLPEALPRSLSSKMIGEKNL